MRRKAYYIIFTIFVLVWGIWYMSNYPDIIKNQNEDYVAGNLNESDIVIEENESVPYIININKADAYELESLDGIGEKKAQSIIEYRNEHGPFKSKNELLNVKGIGESILNNIEDKIKLEE